MARCCAFGAAAQGQGPFPVIVNYSGYDPGSIGGAAYMNDNTAMSVNLDRSLVQAGYAVVGVNARGTACSEGQFEFLSMLYGQDGRDAIEWIATQPWANGSVGMANWSWAGMSISTAAEQPPHLKAIAPGMVLGDARLDSWFMEAFPRLALSMAGGATSTRAGMPQSRAPRSKATSAAWRRSTRTCKPPKRTAFPRS
jgi:putative CocE/NonD family hydrolase